MTTLLSAIAVYLLIGALFALPFAFLGAQRLDGDAARAGFGFRIMILPGAAMLWPLLALRWLRGTGAPMERTPHKRQLLDR